MRRIHDVAKTIFTVDICIRHQDKILMLRRSEAKKAFPGWLALPGGHIEEGENPLATAIRETKEETGIRLTPKEIQLKFIAIHHHLDRNEQYVIFGFLANIENQSFDIKENEEGTLHWIDKNLLSTHENILPPVKYYFNHLLNNKPGILYNNSVWENSKLVKVASEMVNNNS
jgi:8-oxo-dGTP diphosphatase